MLKRLTTKHKPGVALSGRSLRRTLRVQVVAEGLAHPLVTWSTLALDVFPAWSPAWFMIPRKENRENRANSGYSRATSSPSRLWNQLGSSPRSGTLPAERGPGLLLPEVASRPLSRLRVWGPQPLLRARRLDDGMGSRALSARRPLQRMLGD